MEILIDYLNKHNIDFSEADINKFQRYYELLVEYNRKFNLTAITDYEEVQIKHFIDSLSAINILKDAKTVVDIGTGAGFPSIPLAILMPQIKLTLVDSLLKRVNFLNTVISELNLKNAETIHSRAEDMNKSIKYDAAAARAVAPLNILIEYIAPFIAVGGKAVIYKGSNFSCELDAAQNAADALGLKLESIHAYNLFNTDIQRVILEYKKIKPSPPIYPRNQNKPRKFPL